MALPRAATVPRGRADADKDAGGLEDALEVAIGWLARRDCCAAELTERLAARGFSGATVQAALATLGERGYVNDERYAQQFVAAHAGRGQGPLRIRHELLGRGLSAPLISAALQAYAADHGDWAQLARAVRVRRFGAGIPQQPAERTRQARFLQFRGFCNDHIRNALGGGDPLDHAD